MIQPIYTSVSNADIVSCGKKGKLIKSDPIPLLKNNYLGEYRTELERAKARKNLGIGDAYSLQWGNIEGYVESQQDLVNYVESKWHYSTELNEDIKNIQDAMDYALYFVTNFKGEHEAIEDLQTEVESIKTTLTEVNNTLQESIQNNSDDIDKLEQFLQEANNAIVQLNKDLKNIDVDANIITWVKAKLENSKTIELVDDTTLNVIISNKDDNALFIFEQEGVKTGLYVKDLTSEISNNQKAISKIETNISEIKEELSNVYSIEETDNKFVTKESLKGDSLEGDEDFVFVTQKKYESDQSTLNNTIGTIQSNLQNEINSSIKTNSDAKLNSLTIKGDSVVTQSTIDELPKHITLTRSDYDQLANSDQIDPDTYYYIEQSEEDEGLITVDYLKSNYYDQKHIDSLIDELRQEIENLKNPSES